MAKRLKAAERKASILAVAKVLFADRGYHGVSVDDLARRLGVSPAVLYRHFDSKEALYEAVLAEIACTRENYVDAVLTGPTDFGSVLLRMTRVYVDAIAADPDYLRMELLAVLDHSPAARQFFDNRWKAFSDFIEVNMSELGPQGAFDPVDPRSAGLMFQGMLREALYAKCIYDAPHYRELSLPLLVDRLVELFLRAVGYCPEKEG